MDGAFQTKGAALAKALGQGEGGSFTELDGGQGLSVGPSAAILCEALPVIWGFLAPLASPPLKC